MKAYRLIAAIALGGLMACGPIARAEDGTNTPPPPSGGDNTPPARGPRGGRGPNIQAIIDKLDLTADQKAKVKTVMENTREKMTALRDDSSLSREDRQAKMKEIREASDAKLKEILTADQYAKFLELRKQQMNNRPGGPGSPGGARGGAGGNPAPPSNP